MFSFLYEWIQNIAFYLILVTAFVQLIPDSGYKKYVRFFTGLLLVVLLASPILKLMGMEGQFKELYKGAEYQSQMKEMEEKSKYFKDIDINDYIGTDKETNEDNNNIEVGEVWIEDEVQP